MWFISILSVLSIFLFWGCGSYYTPHPKNYTPRYSHATMRPYSVNGKIYYPTVVKAGAVEYGVASWYGPNFHGKKTSNGEIYNMYDFTAAHKTLPMNTRVRVTNLNNGKSVVVRINDRGPFVGNRIIDLSYAAAKKIGMIGTGTAPVKLEVLGFEEAGVSKQVAVLSNFAVQIGAFRRYQGAKITQRRWNSVNYPVIIKKFIVDGAPLYRVWITGFRSEAEARDYVRSHPMSGAFIVRNGS